MFSLFGNRKDVNIGVRHGEWGENVACRHLRRLGFSILDRNLRPCKRDRRCEIDIVAFFKETDTVVFVEVKQHARRSPYQRRLRSIDERKKRVLLRACRSWLRRERWQGGYRFDVIEVYGNPESGDRPEIDHIERVRLFTPEERFVYWA